MHSKLNLKFGQFSRVYDIAQKFYVQYIEQWIVLSVPDIL